MSYPFYEIYSPEPKKGEILSKIVVYEFEHRTKKGRMCVIVNSFSQLGFMGSKVQWHTLVHNKEDGYKRPSFRRRSLLPPLFSLILRFIWNHQLNW